MADTAFSYTSSNARLSSHALSESVFFKGSLLVGLLALVWTFLPSVIAASTLYLTFLVYGEERGQFFGLLSLTVLALCALIMQPARDIAGQLSDRRATIAMEIAARWALLLFVLLLIGYINRLTPQVGRRVLLTWAVVTPVCIVFASLAIRHWMRSMTRDVAHHRRVLFAGCNEGSLSLARRIKETPELCMSVCGFFDDRSAERLGNPNVSLYGGLGSLAAFVRQHGADIIFVALPIRHLRRVQELLDDLRDTTASIYYIPDVFAYDLIQARTSDICGMPVVAMCETPFHGLRGLSKRLFDMVGAGAALLLLAPVFVCIGVLIRASSPGRAIFRQRRYGLDGQEIIVYKFRTMTVTEDGSEIAQVTRTDHRVTPIGRLLRRTSFDELPQLINVLQGTMSLVGPRPHAVAHNEIYRKLVKGYMVRHKVLPGITGLAQINGFRGEIHEVSQMEERVRHDLDYLRRWSILLDIRILALTVLRVFSDKNAY